MSFFRYCFVMFCCSIPSFAWSNPIDDLIEQYSPSSNVGYELIDLETHQVVMEKNAGHAFTPASTLKVMTAAAAILSLGKDYRYTTSVWVESSKIEHSHLHGDLWWRFSGDPSLSTKGVATIVNALKQKGITTIEGDVRIDSQQFSDNFYPWGWSEDSLAWSFFAPITTMMIDQNAGEIRLQGAKHLKQTLDATVYSQGIMMPAASILTTVTDEESEHCRMFLEMPQWNKIRLKGCWPLAQSKARLKFAYRFPNQVALEKLHIAFNKAGIQVRGRFLLSDKKVPAHFKRLVVHESAPVHQLVKTMLKLSDNMIAESLLKTLGQQAEGEGSFVAGLRTRASLLESYADLDLTDADLYDGSGGSNYNLVTPHQMTMLMAKIASDPNMHPVIDGLPISGKDGTLQYRMKDQDLKHLVRAKTGGMKHVTTLTGLLQSSTNKHYAFTLFINHAPHSSDQVKRLQEEICRYWRHY